jgi:hypothetical protein
MSRLVESLQAYTSKHKLAAYILEMHVFTAGEETYAIDRALMIRPMVTFLLYVM